MSNTKGIQWLQKLVYAADNPINSCTEPKIFTLNGVLAICAALIFFAWLIDWLHRTKDMGEWRKRLIRFENKLANLPIMGWQQEIANTSILFWKNLTESYDNFLNRLDRIAPGAVGLLLFIPPLVLILFMLFVKTTQLWFIFLLLISLIGYSVSFIINIVTFELKSKPTRLGIFLLDAIAPALFLSAWFTIGAVIVSSFIDPLNLQSYWFLRVYDDLNPTHPVLMALVNFPFDFVTIIVSIKLLQFVKDRGKHMVSLAVVDIFISAVLVVLLQTTLKTIEPGGVGHIYQNFLGSIDWFAQLITFKALSTHPDWLLTPILLTTFIPVVIYMSALIFLGIIVKPFAKAASHICGVMWEKEQTPYLVLSIILSQIIALAKALSKWEWFAYQIKEIL